MKIDMDEDPVPPADIQPYFAQEVPSLKRFRRALRLEDQRVLDDLFARAREFQSAAKVAQGDGLSPFDLLLISQLIKEHQQIAQLQREVEQLTAELLHRLPKIRENLKLYVSMVQRRRAPWR